MHIQTSARRADVPLHRFARSGPPGWTGVGGDGRGGRKDGEGEGREDGELGEHVCFAVSEVCLLQKTLERVLGD